LWLALTARPIEATIRPGYNMNINDKIDIVNLRIKLIEDDIYEHNRILKEDILQDGDEEVINNSLLNLRLILDALK
jgi:hypothetical protein